MKKHKAAQENSPTKPGLALLVKLGSAVVHAHEYLGSGSHAFDRSAFDALWADPEVREWIAVMQKSGYLPVERT